MSPVMAEEKVEVWTLFVCGTAGCKRCLGACCVAGRHQAPPARALFCRGCGCAAVLGTLSRAEGRAPVWQGPPLPKNGGFIENYFDDQGRADFCPDSLISFFLYAA